MSDKLMTEATRDVWKNAPLVFRRGRVRMGPTELSRHIYLSKTATRFHLLKLCRAGLVQRISVGKRKHVYAGVQGEYNE